MDRSTINIISLYKPGIGGCWQWQTIFVTIPALIYISSKKYLLALAIIHSKPINHYFAKHFDPEQIIF